MTVKYLVHFFLLLVRAVNMRQILKIALAFILTLLYNNEKIKTLKIQYKYLKIKYGVLKMKSSIKNYIEYLTSSCGLKISLHGEGVLPHLDFLAPYNAHECVYCMYVKSSTECWHRCREGQRRVLEKLCKSGAFFGSCYAGVGEFVFPIFAFDSVVGMISVGGYVGSAEKRGAFALKYGFHEARLKALSEEELKSEVPDFNFVKTLIEPLSCMLTLFIEKSSSSAAGAENLYGKILSLLHTGYTQKIKIGDIADKCHYSPSFISRYFKKKSGVTVSEYLAALRMEKAKKLLLNSDMRIEDIAASVGFFDTNYFISFFSRYYGCPPKRYKNANKT